MLECRDRPDLAHEPLGADHGGELGAEHLDGDPPAVLQVLGQVDRRHPALPQLALDLVPIGQRRLEGRDPLAHRTTHAASFRSSAWMRGSSRTPSNSGSNRIEACVMGSSVADEIGVCARAVISRTASSR